LWFLHLNGEIQYFSDKSTRQDKLSAGNLTAAKEQMRCSEKSKQRIRFPLPKYRSISKGFGESYMYTLDSPILYSEETRGE
jgi:hypothetical protein